MTSFVEFDSPPVNEVVCGVQFNDLPGFSMVHAVTYWQTVKDRFPLFEEKPPLPLVQELPGIDSASIPLGVGITDLPPLRRLFFLESNRNFLVQLQESRFLMNWRRIKEEDKYPRFDTVFAAFRRDWSGFVSFLKNESLPVPVSNQYELTYIDHVLESEVSLPAGIEESTPVFSWSRAQSTGFLPAPHALTIAMQFKLPDDRGSLRVSINHGQRKNDGRKLLLMNLTARGPAKADEGDMGEWFELAHEWIVKGFKDLTSIGAHQKWGAH